MFRVAFIHANKKVVGTLCLNYSFIFNELKRVVAENVTKTMLRSPD